MAWKNVKNNKMIFFCSAVIIMLLISMIVFLVFTMAPSDFRNSDHEIFDEADENVGGIPKTDSDFRWIGNQKVPWPDKLSDIEETYIYGTNRTNPDTDGDGMEDGWEAMYGVRNPITGRLTIDPNKADAFENPDGDGYDEYPVWTEYMNGIPMEHRGNGILDGGDELTNIEEYVGGAFTGIFQWLDPEMDAQEIATTWPGPWNSLNTRGRKWRNSSTRISIPPRTKRSPRIPVTGTRTPMVWMTAMNCTSGMP